MESRAQDQRFATTLAHGLALLRCFTPFEPTLSNGELARRSGLSKATVSRLSYTLELIGMLCFDHEARRYRLGAAALSMGHPLMAQLAVRQLARPLMQRLADRMGATVSLGLQHRDCVIYIETTRAHDAGDFRPDIGASLPLLETAVGRAWLAASGEPERALAFEWLRRQQRISLHRLQALAGAARQELQVSGYCLSAGDFRRDVNAMALPLRQRFRGELVVLNCGVLRQRMDAERMVREVAPLLMATAAAIDRLQEEHGEP
ncbi:MULTISPECIES: IclR family transcriptional regulator [Comamonas]|uniref:IclR family transcriptional regulator n=1 Tax=Comamonas TaxID=283 RepID=UPI0007C5A1FD|nr:IclR family transcriptional regulator [Comamonas thiooxydans]MCO8250893.1 IclR family transcriptional regulator [Comamonas thiooxydans]OAD83231.1 hypothetical protein ATN89_15690 [Comamonas thiooxydans]UBQ40798.1 IclR family transcriptional regulator [Comamonas thiooxydans]